MKKVSRGTPREFSYSGRLQDNPLAEILFTIGQHKVPGVLTFSLERITKQLYLRDGRITFASSNLTSDRLGEYLFRIGKITRAQLDRSSQMLLKSKNKRQGQILMDLKALRADDLRWAVTSHQQAIVWSLFNWFQGDMTFNIGTYKEKEPIQMDLTIPRTILDGVRTIQRAKRIIRYIGEKNSILETDENALLAIEVFGAEEKEREILKRVDGKTTLYDLCASMPYGPHETAKILYGLMTLKLIHRREDRLTPAPVPV